MENDDISEDLKTYLKERHKTRKQWVKCYMKSSFCCGTCTTSRIEAKHRVYKTYLNGNTRLCELFRTFQKLETQEVIQFKEEVQKIDQSKKKEFDKIDLMKSLSKDYGSYVLEKLKGIILEAFNYSVEAKNNKW